MVMCRLICGYDFATYLFYAQFWRGAGYNDWNEKNDV